MYADQFGEVVSGYRGLKGQLVRFLLVQEDLEGIRVTGYLTLSELVLSPTYFINLSFKTEDKRLWCYQSKKHIQGTLAITLQFHLFIYYLFNHFHHIVWNTQQKSETQI